jgi:hypothetical protein
MENKENLPKEIITQWIIEGQCNDQELGYKLRDYYWNVINKN